VGTEGRQTGNGVFRGRAKERGEKKKKRKKRWVERPIIGGVEVADWPGLKKNKPSSAAEGVKRRGGGGGGGGGVCGFCCFGGLCVLGFLVWCLGGVVLRGG